ncbi:oligopeptidase A [Escherichia coli]|uniref:Oligopeptidase A n=1 Tax=Escherichia coli TaxID=562 RepID=A0A447XQ68_ECOLX|nr:oligopeptidase A [Escherichia coli]
MTNPLLTPFELPPFSKILPEHVVPAVTKALNDCRENVERVVAQGHRTPGKISASRWRKWTMCWAYLLPGQPSELGEK